MLSGAAGTIGTLALAAALGFSAGAAAQPATAYDPIVLPVACGGAAQAACAKVVPRLAARSVQSGIILRPMGSGLAIDTAAAVCEGAASAAIVQRDALAMLARLPGCPGRYDVVGRPLYPWYAFLIVKAGAPFHEFADLAGKRLVVTGAPGSNGQIALAFLLRSDAALQRKATVLMGDPEVALDRVAVGAADGYFALASLDSALLNRVRQTLDAHGKPFFSFIDIRPPPEFFSDGKAASHCLYRLTALDFGGGAPVTTISEDAVMVLARSARDAHARGGPRASDVLAGAIDAAEPAILADMKSPDDWRPVGTTCQ